MLGDKYNDPIEQGVRNAVGKLIGKDKDHCAECNGNAQKDRPPFLAEQISKTYSDYDIHFNMQPFLLADSLSSSIFLDDDDEYDYDNDLYTPILCSPHRAA